MLDLLVLELVLVIGLFLLAGAARRSWAIPFRKWERHFDRLASHRARSILLVTLLCLGIRLTLLPLEKIPTPGTHDEFSYLLAADTFASGRLTNPIHPMWVHFETFHVNQRPTYHSMYQPAQGVALALGQVLFGHPWFGVWLSAGLMCGVITWALYGWLPPRWALLGGLIALLRLGIFSYWMNSYWGGAVPAIGGALVIGALPRILRAQRSRDSLLMALGIAILAGSRPWEGGVLALTALGILAYGLWRRKVADLGRFSRRVLIPMAALLLVCSVALMYYFWRLTGNPLEMPYQLNRATYGVSQPFYWQTLPPAPVLHHRVMSNFYLGRDLDWYVAGSTVSGFLSHQLNKLQFAWLFFIGPVLLVPLAMIAYVLRDRRVRPVLVIAGVSLLAIVVEAWRFVPHYMAPVTAALYILLLQGMRHWRAVNRRTAGPLMAWGVPVICLIMLLARAAADTPRLSQYLAVDRNAWWCYIPGGLAGRDRILRDLNSRPGRHLVLVRYEDDHDVYGEWVYNGANVDQQKVIWARDMDEAANRELLSYYRDRHAWVVDADAANPELNAYNGPPKPTSAFSSAN